MSKRIKTLICICLTSIITLEAILLFSSHKAKADSSQDYRSIAYFTSWSAYARGVNLDYLDPELITHLNFAFANLNNKGDVLVGDANIEIQKEFSNGAKGHFGYLKKIKKAYPHLKTLISIGGGTWSGNFSDVAASDSKRKHFAKSAVSFMKKYGFDGIDIDWEFPVEGGAGIKHRSSDGKNYTKLLKEVRKQLNAQGKKDKKKYLLSIAGGPNVSFTKHNEIKNICKYVDYINVMTYDYHGSWESTTNFNAPLYVNKKDPTREQNYSVSGTIDAYLKAGAPGKKLNLGLAFYGKGWIGVTNKNNGLFQKGSLPYGTGLGKGTWEGGNFDYWDLQKNYVNKNGYKRYYDKTSKVPYLYNKKTKIFITYDDKESVKAKMDYVKEKGLGGAMFWEFSGDKKKELQKVIARELNINK